MIVFPTKKAGQATDQRQINDQVFGTNLFFQGPQQPIGIRSIILQTGSVKANRFHPSILYHKCHTLLEQSSIADFRRTAAGLGVRHPDPLLTLITLTGAAIPYLRICEEGLVNLKDGKTRPLFTRIVS